MRTLPLLLLILSKNLTSKNLITAKYFQTYTDPRINSHDNWGIFIIQLVSIRHKQQNIHLEQFYYVFFKITK